MRGCVRSLEGSVVIGKQARSKCAFDLCGHCVAAGRVATGFVPRVSCFTETVDGAGGIRLVAGNKVRWGRRNSGCRHQRGKTGVRNCVSAR